MLRLILLLLINFLFACQSLGIHLSETQILRKPSSLICNNTREFRTYRALFLLPIRKSDLDGDEKKADETIVRINEYAKPWDIAFTALGFMFSMNSSTTIYESCITKNLLAQISSENVGGNALPHYKPALGGKSVEQILFSKDDSLLSETERSKVSNMVEKLKRSEDKFQLVLVGKTNTSGDIAYQVRLIKKRIEEIKTVLVSASIVPEKIHTVYAEKESSDGDSHSSVQVYLVKD